MTTQESFICVLCKESFEDKETLQIHFRKHSDPAFNNQPKKSSPNQSEESKEGDAKVDLVSCDVCPEVFPTISKAITHKHKVHPDHDAKYFCHWCGKLFTLMHLFNKHLTSHVAMLQGEEKFHCDCCNVDFFVPSAMLYHNKFFHRQDTDLPGLGHSKKQKFVNKELMQLYYCAFCGEEYINKVNLHKHMKDEHGDENQSPEDILRCPLCEAVFYHLDAYEVHLTFHDSDDIYNGKDDDLRKEDISEFTLDTVPPIMEKVENAEPEEGEKAVGLDELLQLAMNEDSNVSGKKKHKKHKKHKKSKKETITLDEFLNMNTEVFGEGLDFQVHGVEEVPTKVVKRLSVQNKSQKVLKPLSKVATPELERLKKQGIVIKNVNKPRVAPGIKIKGSPPMGSLKVANNVSTKATVTTKTPQNSQTQVKPSNEEVLSKLLSQSQNQIVISKKSQSSNPTNNDNTGSPTVNVFGSAVATPEDIEVQCDVRMTSSSELGEDDKIDSSKSKPTLEHEAINDNEASEKNDSTTQDKAPELSNNETKEVETKHNTESEDNEGDNILEKQVQPEVNSNVNILKGISQHITVKSLSQPKPTSPVNSSPKRDETCNPEVCKPAENIGQADLTSQEAVNGSPKKAPLDVLKNLGHLTIKSSQKPSSPTVSYKDKEDAIVSPTVNKKSQESDKAKTEQNKSNEVLKKVSPNITVKQAAHQQASEGDASDVDKHFDFDDELDEHESDHHSESEADALDTKSHDIPANKNVSIAPAALKNISQAITMKKTYPTKSNGNDAPSIAPPPQQRQVEPNDAIKKLSSQLTVKSINRPPVNRILPKKTNTNDDEIVSIDDSDSDDIESKAKSHINKPNPANASKSIHLQKVAQVGQTAPPRPVVKKPPQNVAVKKETTVTEDDTGTGYDEFDLEDDIKPNVINKPVMSNVAQKLLNNKNISLKNMNKDSNKKPQTPNRMNSPQNSPNNNHTTNPVVETRIVKYKPREHVSDYDSDGGDFPDDFSNHSNDGTSEDPGNTQPNRTENDINKNMKEFNFDSDEHHFSDENDDRTCGSNSQSLIDKLKNINQNLSIKSSNQNKNVVASASSYQNFSKNVTVKTANDNKRQVIQKQVSCLKRESSELLTENDDDDDEDAVATPSKHLKVAEQSRELVKRTSIPVQRAPGRPGPASRQASQQTTNTVNQQVTTSVKTIQSETVVEEITTTVTRTIKTINREVSMSGNQTISKVNVAPNVVQGGRPRLSPSLQGVAVRQAAPGQASRPRMRPTRPVVNTNVRVPNQVLPARPSMNQIRPTTPRMPMKVRTVAPNQQTRPIKIAQNVKQALTKVNRAPTLDPPGPFSCFKKPKESLIPMDSSDDEFSPEMQAPSSLKMNIAGTSKSMQSQSVFEMTSSHQQISKLSTVSGLKVVKSSSQSKQVVNKVEKCEVSSNRTLEAIQRLQKQGLLVKKPRLEEPEDEGGGGGGLLAIEDAPH